MELKSQLGIEIFINESGKIVLRQHCELTYEDKYIILSPDEFTKISLWVQNHQDEIINVWNDGIFIEDSDEIDS